MVTEGTVVSKFKDICEQSNENIIFISSKYKEKSISYKELYANSLHVLENIQGYGIHSGDKLIVQIDDDEMYIYTIWACMLGGIIPVIVGVCQNVEDIRQLKRIYDVLEQPRIITLKKDITQAEGKLHQAEEVERIVCFLKEKAIYFEDFTTDCHGVKLHNASKNDIALIQFSSGSTGTPKGVIITHENLLVNIYDVIKGCQIKENNISLSWLPLIHDFGLIMIHMTNVIAGIKQVIMSTKLFLQEPMLWLEKASLHKATHLSTPNFGLRAVIDSYDNAKTASLDLSSVRYIFNGAEPISKELCEKFLDIMKAHHLSRKAMKPVYGLAEATVGVTYTPMEEEYRYHNLNRNYLGIGDKVQIVSEHDPKKVVYVEVGTLFEHFTMRICDQDDNVLDDSTIGYLQVKGESIAKGYYKNEQVTNEVFKNDGWLNTGDLGYLCNGRVIITGRAKDIIINNGVNIYPSDLERIAENILNMKNVKVYVAGVSNKKEWKEDILVFVLNNGELNNRPDIMYKLKEELYLQMGIKVSRVIPINEVAKTQSGKVRRHVLVQRFLQGKYDSILHSSNVSTLGNNSYADIEHNLLNIFSKVIKDKRITLDDSFFEIGVDSVVTSRIQCEIDKIYEGKVKTYDFFAYPSIRRLASYIGKCEFGENFDHKEVQKMEEDNEIAIIGMAAKFPMADDIDEFWNNLLSGTDCVTDFPESRRKDMDQYLAYRGELSNETKYQKGAYLKEIDQFDYEFFGLTPKEAMLMSPCQRLFLEVCMKAIEDSGYGGNKLIGSNTGIYLGAMGDYDGYAYKEMIEEVLREVSSVAVTGNLSCIMPSRVSHFLDWKGPAMVIDTACSSSLVAVHLACQSLLNGDCNIAIAGGVRINMLPLSGKVKLGIESKEGKVRAFDDSSDGTGIGEGIGIIVLKPLKAAIKDHDQIYAVIKGSAINNDGKAASLTAPNLISQAKVIEKAWNKASISPDTISYIEAHGTGTKLGDPIEIKALEMAFRKYTNKNQFCAIGTVKSNMGHLHEAAGIAGMIKAVLALKHKQIPASIHFNYPNKNISFESSPLYINDQLIDWTSEYSKRRCGVSAFGFSGTNAHVILEEAPQVTQNKHNGFPLSVLPISARTPNGVNCLISEYIRLLEKVNEITDICYTAQTGRGHYTYRLAIIFQDKKELIDKLKGLEHKALKQDTTKGIYYAYHRMVGDLNQKKDISDVYESEITSLGTQADELLEVFQYETDNHEVLQKICLLYCRGAEIQWNRIYVNQLVNKISLPTYPFEKKRCWIAIPSVSLSDMEHWKNQPYYQAIFIKEELLKQRDVREDEHFLIISSRGSKKAALISDKLRANGKIISVELDNEYVQVNENTYYVGNNVNDYDKLFTELSKENITKIIHMTTIDGDNLCNADEIQQTIHLGAMNFLYCYQAMCRIWNQKDIEFILLSRYANKVVEDDEMIIPQNAILYGIGRVVVRESKFYACRAIDTDDVTDTSKLAAEIVADSKSYYVAFRKGNRYVETLDVLKLDSIKEDRITIKKEGIYVITGGLSGIGFEMAKYLASKDRINIAVLSRSIVPRRNEWDFIQKTGSDKKTNNMIKSIQELEKMNANVECISVDATDFAKVETVFRELRIKYKKINGVINSVGIMGMGLLKERDEKEFLKVISTKVFSTLNLDIVTREDELDFMVLFSSISSILRIPEQGDYSAGNAFLDAFAAYRNNIGKKTLVVNWPAWKETGMAKDNNFNIDTAFKTISSIEGIQCFDRLLNKKISRAVVGRINFDGGISKWLNAFSIQLSKDISLMIADTKIDQQKQINHIYQEKTTNSMECIGDYGDIEKNLLDICSEVLGITNIDIEESFFDMGANSMLITQLQEKINLIYPGIISVAQMFSYSSISKLAGYIKGKYSDEKDKPYIQKEKSNTEDDIAIIGLSINMPGCNTLDDFWKLIRSGNDAISNFPENRRHDIDTYLSFKGLNREEHEYIQAAYLDEIDKFDYKFFHISPKEASLMDPNQRLFLQTAYRAIEDSGYGGDSIKDTKTGVFVGFAEKYNDFYAKYIEEVEPESVSMSVSGNLASIIPSRISYYLDLKGPSILIDTACSSALVSIHLACNSLNLGECEMALAGGVKVNYLPVKNRVKLGIESSDYRTKAFDDSSDGTGIGEGVAAVMLKPLKKALRDKDHVYAVIKGSAINQDGHSTGITAPNAAAQTDVIVNAWRKSGVPVETIRYIEAHGTGTVLGDPIEIEGLDQAFRKFTNKKSFCNVSSVKTNIGHLYEAAGMAGFVKAVLSLQNGELAPNAHFSRLNHRIKLEHSAVYIGKELEVWENAEYPRRCGVSSFGFSGTNCHMILEQAVEASRNTECTERDIFTLSAISEAVLLDSVNQYREFVETDHGLSMNDICYTANAGRGHYECRLAFIVNDMDDLKSKIDYISKYGIKAQKLQHIYYKTHKLIRNNISILQNDDITIEDKHKMTKKSSEAAKLLSNKAQWDEDELENIISLYISGADIDWKTLYINRNRRRVSIPVYPLERSRCWLELDSKLVIKNKGTEAAYHPLLERMLVQVLNETIYETVFTPAKHFVLNEHIVLSKYVIPGTTYLEILKQVSIRHFGECCVEFKDILFITPVVLNESEMRTVYTIVKEEADFLNVTVASRIDNAGEKWIKHAEAKIYKCDKGKDEWINVNELRSLFSKKELIINFDEITNGFIQYGTRFRCCKKLYMEDGRALAYMELHNKYITDLDIYYIHPSLLDIATASVALTLGERFLPIAYQSFKIYSKMPDKFYSYVMERKGSSTKEVIAYDIVLLDLEGKIFVEIQQFKLKKAEKFEKNITKTLYHSMLWNKKNANTELKQYMHEENVMVIYRSNQKAKDIYSEIIKRETNVIGVKIGSQFLQEDRMNFIVGHTEDSYEQLFHALKGKKIAKLVYLSSIGLGYEVHELESNLLDSVYGLFYVVQAIMKSKLSDTMELQVASDNAGSVTGEESNYNPFGNAVFGLARVIDSENINYKVKCIDIDDNTPVENVVNEMICSIEDKQIAFRNGERYVPQLTGVNLDEVADEKVEIRRDGVYIITGGTGAIGLEMAKYIAAKDKVKLVLISRTELPDRSTWKKNRETADFKMLNVIDTILKIEENGSSVICFSLDVSNKEQLKAAIKKINDMYGDIHGIVHCAGIAGDGFLFRKGFMEFERVLKPKIHGTWLLAQITKEMNLDFFVTCSSAAAVLSEPGQSDYTAANCFMDTFVLQRAKTIKKALSIEWTAWDEVGMAFEHKANVDTILKPIKTKQAMMAFEKLLNKKINLVAVGELSDDGLGKFQTHSFNPALRIEENLLKKRVTGNEGIKVQATVNVKGKGKADYSEVELNLSNIWARVLGVAEINIYESFYDIGGDSILATYLLREIQKEFGKIIDISDVFSYPTISQMANYIIKNSIQEEYQEDPVSIMARDQMLDKSGDKIVQYENEDIAIIGIDGIFPKAKNLNEFWNNLKENRKCISEFPKERRTDVDGLLEHIFPEALLEEDPYEIQGYLDDIDQFDAAFFGISPTEANLIEPEQRLFLQCAWRALEDAGLSGDRIYDSKTGVFVGKANLGQITYKNLIKKPDASAFTGSINGILASRISYILNLHGPSMVIDTACSSSLVALHQACASLRNRECDYAIVGGVSVTLLPAKNIETKMLESEDGELRPFDKHSNGTVWGEGVGAIILRPLKEAERNKDSIYAVIKASGLNNDGASNGITAPSAKAQEELYVNTWKKYGIDPETISYIEAHGTGTSLGDPIEVKGLNNAIRKFTSKRQFCGLGTVKGNIGHLIAASGIASLMKVILAIKNEEIPATIGFNETNPLINFEESPLYVMDKPTKWTGGHGLRRAAISSFGLSGTNCHVVLEEPAPNDKKTEEKVQQSKVFAISAKSKSALERLVKAYLEYAESSDCGRLEDICYTALLGRDHYKYRLAFWVNDIYEWKEILRKITASNWRELNKDRIYYGYHKIVSKNKLTIHQGEVTKEFLDQISDKVQNNLTEGYKAGYYEERILKEILQLYVQGAKVKWDIMYQDKSCSWIHLPSYSFEEKRCWANNTITKESTNSSMYYNMQWIPSRFEFSDNAIHKEEAIIIRGDGAHENELYLSLCNRYQDSMRMLPALYSVKEDENWIAQVDAFFAAEGMNNISKIIYLGAITEYKTVSSLEDLENSQQCGVLNLFYFVKSIMKHCKDKEISIDIVTEGAFNVTGDESLYPQNASLQGFGRIVARENALISCRCIDIDEYTDTSYICQEIESKHNEYAVAYRKGQRYIEEFTEEYVENGINSLPELKKEGVYIVTGGAGGLGLAVTESFTKNNSINVVLLNRSKLPEREEWDTVLLQQGKTREHRIIAAIKQMEQSADSHITTMAVDITNYNQVKDSLDLIRKEYGKINGVVHSAGIANHELIIEESEEEFKRILKPKIQGTWILDELTRDDNLDFLILFSSISTTFGMAGQADYSAANSFMDAYAYKRGKEGQRVLSIDWVAWKEVGMSAEQGFTKDTIFKSITTERAMDALKGIFGMNIHQVIIGELNYDSNVIKLLSSFPFLISEKIQRRISDCGKNRKHFSNEQKNRKQESVIHPMVERLELESFNQDVYVTEFSPLRHWLLSEHQVADNYAIAGMAYPEVVRVISRRYFGNSTIELRDFVYITPVMFYSNEETKQVQFIITKQVEDELGFIVSSKTDTPNGPQWQMNVQGKFRKYDSVQVKVNQLDKLKERCNKGVKRIVFNDTLNGFFKFGERWAKSVELLLGENEVLFEVKMHEKFLGDLDVYQLHPAIMDISINAMGYLLSDKYLPLSFGSFIIYDTFGEKTFSYIKRTSDENAETVTYDIQLMDKSGRVIIEVKDFILKRVHSVKSLLENNKPKMEAVKKVKNVKLIGKEDDAYTDNERIVAAIWGEILGFDEIDIYEDFYNLGGDSIFAVKIVNNLNKEIGINISVVNIFQYLTVYDLAQFISQTKRSDNERIDEFAHIPKIDKQDYYETSSAQSSLLILDSLNDKNEKNIGYNIPEMLLIEGNLKLTLLKSALDTLAQRHESIRTCFKFVNGMPVQQVLENVHLELCIYDSTESNVNDIIRKFIQPFDLYCAPLFRVGLVKLSKTCHIFMLDMHHIVSDGWSEMIFIRELIDLLCGKELSTIEIQYKDYAAWHNKYIASDAIKSQEQYWINKFNGQIPLLHMPTDYPRPKQRSYDGDRIVLKIDIGLRDKLNSLATRTETTLYMVLLAVYNVVLAKYSGQEDMIIGSPNAGRGHKDLQNVIGMFVNMMAMRNQPKRTMTFTEFLLDVKKNALEAYANQDIPFNQIVGQLNFERDITRNPLFDYVFALHNFELPELTTKELKFSLYEFDYRISRFDMYLFVVDLNGEFRIELEYSTKLFKKSTAERFVNHYVEAIEQIIEHEQIMLQDIVLSSELAEINTNIIESDDGNFDF